MSKKSSASKIAAAAAFAALLSSASGCYGMVYRKHTSPGLLGNGTNELATRACVRSYLGLVTVGDATVERAIAQSDLIALHSSEREHTIVLGFVYRRYCLILTGNQHGGVQGR